MAEQRSPGVSSELVDWLSGLFPDRCPDEADSDRVIWMAVGAQKVIKKLRATADNQSLNVLHDD